MKSFLIFLVNIYRMVGAPHMGGACRFEPSCSEYAVLALQSKPLKESIRLVCFRLLKCRPFGAFGYDPVPKLKEIKNAK